MQEIQDSTTLSVVPEHALQGMVAMRHDGGEIFGSAYSGYRLAGYRNTTLFTPCIDPAYIFHDTLDDMLAWFSAESDPLYLFGPTGSGKTSLVKQVAARINYPVFDVTGHSRLEFPDLAGHLTVHEGSMRYQYGPLALAMRYGGIFLLNEIDLLDPATSAGLNGVLDGEPLCIPENQGELIIPHPNFRFAATANSNGASDSTGLYQGVLRQNLAFMDRFWLCEVEYPQPEAEIQILRQVAPELPEAIVTNMVTFANEVRAIFLGNGSADAMGLGEGIEITFSTRTIIRWADLTQRFLPLLQRGISPVRHALDRALGFRASPETRQMLHGKLAGLFPRTYI